MLYNEFYNSDKFIILPSDMRNLINNLINKFEERKFKFDLQWRNYRKPISKKQFTFKNTDILYNIKVIITVTISIDNENLKIEVHNGKFRVGNLFTFDKNTSDENLNELFNDIGNTLGIN